MYTDEKSSVRVKSQYSPWFEIHFEVHLGFFLKAILFIIVKETLLRHSRKGCNRGLLYTDNLFIIAETHGELLKRFHAWKTN